MIHVLLDKINQKQLIFSDVIAYIDTNYNYSAGAFTNGNQMNNANENQGSAKIFSFASLNNLSEKQTLSLFGEHYQAVLESPNEDNHPNIRQFMIYGWKGVFFNKPILVRKQELKG